MLTNRLVCVIVTNKVYEKRDFMSNKKIIAVVCVLVAVGASFAVYKINAAKKAASMQQNTKAQAIKLVF